jgi:hypothetical protein
MATFSTIVCEFELKYGANYTKVFTFKQLAHYVHSEALDVYDQHFPRILGIIQIPNPAFGTAIATTLQLVLQTAIAHHGTMHSNLNLIPISINFSPQQFIIVTTNNPPTIDAPDFTDQVGEFFRILELEFSVKSSKKNLQLATFSWKKDETLKMFYRRLLKLKEDSQSITDLEVAHRYFRSLESTLTLHAQVLQRDFVEFGDSYTLLDV